MSKQDPQILPQLAPVKAKNWSQQTHGNGPAPVIILASDLGMISSPF